MRHHRPLIEPLETRRLLSSAIFYKTGTAHGELIVHGDPNTPNNIVISQIDKNTKYQVVHNGITDVFPKVNVKTIYLFGGDANDVISVDDPKHTFLFGVKIFGRGGDDTLTGGSGRDSIGGGDGDDVIEGAYGNDILDGGAGNDAVYGGFVSPVKNDGNDMMFGGDGDDTLVGGSGFDREFGEAGDDVMYGGLPNDPKNVYGDESDDMFGGDGNDTMYADRGRNRMHGMNGNDTLYGGINNDTLYGGAGDNEVHGGGGKDLGKADGEWQFLYRLLKIITPKKPIDPHA